MSRVLVTGSAGFIGRHVVAALVGRGFEVHGVDRRACGVPGVVDHLADLMDPAAVRAVVGEVRAPGLVHLAWYVEPGAFWRSAANLDWVSASLGLARAFAEAGGTRIVGAGTCAEYAWGGAVLDEGSTALEPATLYGACKDGLRRLLTAWGAEAGVSVAWGRVFFLYGPGEAPGRLVGDAVRTLAAGGRFATSHGRQRRDFLHVADVGGAFAALLDSGVVGAVNIGSGKAVPVGDVLRAVAAAVGGLERIDFGARALGASEPEVVEAAVERLRGEVGFVPRFDMVSGVADVVGALGV